MSLLIELFSGVVSMMSRLKSAVTTAKLTQIPSGQFRIAILIILAVIALLIPYESRSLQRRGYEVALELMQAELEQIRPLIITNSEGRITKCNIPFLQMVDCQTSADVLSRNIQEFLPEEMQAHIEELFRVSKTNRNDVDMVLDCRIKEKPLIVMHMKSCVLETRLYIVTFEELDDAKT